MHVWQFCNRFMLVGNCYNKGIEEWGEIIFKAKTKEKTQRKEHCCIKLHISSFPEHQCCHVRTWEVGAYRQLSCLCLDPLIQENGSKSAKKETVNQFWGFITQYLLNLKKPPSWATPPNLQPASDCLANKAKVSTHLFLADIKTLRLSLGRMPVRPSCGCTSWHSIRGWCGA